MYAVCDEVATLTREELANATPKDQMRYFNAFVLSLLAQFQTLVHTTTGDLLVQGIAYSTSPCFLTDAEYQQVVTEIRDLLASRLAYGSEGGRCRRLISIVVIPESNREKDET